MKHSYRHHVLELGHPALRKRAAEVSPSWFGDPLQALVDHMTAVMHAHGGMGLAAPQIGVMLRVVVILRGDQELAYINPVIPSVSGPLLGTWEGCLSIPGQRGYVRRRSCVALTYCDVTGAHHVETLRDLDAVVIQHECDHLDGILYVDKLADPRCFFSTAEVEAYPGILEKSLRDLRFGVDNDS